MLCYSTNHWANKCSSKSRCNTCSHNHRTLLHPTTLTRNPGRSNSSTFPVTLCTSASGSAPVDRSQPVTNVQGIVECSIQPRFANEPALAITTWVLPSVTGIVPRTALLINQCERYSNLALVDPEFNTPSSVNLLIGGDAS